jgi:hypothetical protein
MDNKFESGADKLRKSALGIPGSLGEYQKRKVEHERKRTIEAADEGEAADWNLEEEALNAWEEEHPEK